MSSYSGTAERPDRAKAIAGVAAVHAALAAMILLGLNVTIARQTVERLTTIDVHEQPPQAPAPTAEVRKSIRKPQEPKQTAVVTTSASPAHAPGPLPAPIPAPPVVSAAPAPVSGSTPAPGTGASGAGTGAAGTDASSAADYSGYSPPGLIRNLSRRDYRALAGRLPNGAAMVSLTVEPDGMPANCRVMRSSGDPNVDAGLCPLIEQRLRFRPALDNQGRPIPFQLQYVATWST